METVYVIKSVAVYTDKKGVKHDLVSYFEAHKMGLFNCMESTPDKAKHYEFKGEARRDVRKFFHNRKGVTVVKHIITEI